MAAKQNQDQDQENKSGRRLQLVTFEVGHALLALDISSVQEINRNLRVTHVPHAPPFVSGVTNLRGEVVTILDPHVILGMNQANRPKPSRNLIVKHDGELFGLLVEKVSDILSIDSTLSAPPANLQGIPRKLIRGVHQAPGRLVMILDLEEVLACAAATSN